MNPNVWFDVWFKLANKAIADDCELTVFRIPKLQHGNTDTELVEEIEALIQSKYPNIKS